MKQLIVTENHGLFTAATHDGRHASGASAQSALDKLFGPGEWGGVTWAFETLDAQENGQFRQGQAGA